MSEVFFAPKGGNSKEPGTPDYFFGGSFVNV